MSLIFTRQPQVLIQGLTGKEGQRAAAWMKATGTKVVAGVTPGKGGQEVEGTPIYNSVEEALAASHLIDISCIYVPPQFVLAAAKEAITSKVPIVHIIAEGVPTKDTAILIEQARKHGVRVVGPSSIGWSVPAVSSVGSIGAGSLADFLPATIEEPGVAVISKSGGMANTIANVLTYGKIPQSLAIGIGGDRLIGTTYADLLPDLAADPQTKAVVIIGEIGGAYEEVLAEEITKQHFPKKVVAFISGLFAETLPQGVAFGHAGAIVSKTEGTRQGKIDALKKAGVLIATTPEEIVELLSQK
ncbi:MAG TPA: CoA-binding protein [Patescibacteria group bacterium]